MASMLFTAAVMETATIMDPIFGIDLWVPTALAIVALALISGRLSLSLGPHTIDRQEIPLRRKDWRRRSLEEEARDLWPR